jgi:hypothetical protein
LSSVMAALFTFTGTLSCFSTDGVSSGETNFLSSKGGEGECWWMSEVFFLAIVVDRGGGSDITVRAGGVPVEMGRRSQCGGREPRLALHNALNPTATHLSSAFLIKQMSSPRHDLPSPERILVFGDGADVEERIWVRGSCWAGGRGRGIVRRNEEM